MKPKPIYEECQHYQSFSVNHCPLDPERDKRQTLPDDPKTQCRAMRKSREAIAAKHKEELPWGGLLEREVKRDLRREAARARWAALPPEQQAKLTSRLPRKGTPGEADPCFSAGPKGKPASDVSGPVPSLLASPTPDKTAQDRVQAPGAQFYGLTQDQG